MNSHAASLENLQNRIVKLERQNRRFKQLGAIGLAGVALMLVMAQAPAKKVVEANELAIKDSAGRVRVRIGVDSSNDAAELWLQDAKGDQGASLSNSGLLLKQGGVARTILQSGEVTLANSHGQPSIKLSGAEDAEHAVAIEGGTGNLFYAPGEPLQISDNDGYEASIGSTELRPTSTAGAGKTSAASVVLFDPDKKVIWKAP
jgi:hypothetical protein